MRSTVLGGPHCVGHWFCQSKRLSWTSSRAWVLDALKEPSLVLGFKLCILKTIFAFPYRNTFHEHCAAETVNSFPRNIKIMEVCISSKLYNSSESLDSKTKYFCVFFPFLHLEIVWERQIVAGLHPMRKERVMQLSQNWVQETAVVKIPLILWFYD